MLEKGCWDEVAEVQEEGGNVEDERPEKAGGADCDSQIMSYGYGETMIPG